MKEEETIRFAKGLSKEEFNSVEPQLAYLNKYLTLRSYVDGYTQSQTDSTLWVAIRGQQGCARLRVNKAHLVNLCRWFTFVEQSHPELQEEIVRKDDAAKAGKAAQSRAGASYDIALQDAEMGKVVIDREIHVDMVIEAADVSYSPESILEEIMRLANGPR